MTRDETIKVLTVLRGAYPNFYKGISVQQAEATVALWMDMFQDEPGQVVAMAVKALIATDTKGFPPVIGQVKEKIQMLTQPAQMTEQEAWAHVARALRNSTYGSAEEFAKLPPVVQQLVGSPNQLREWAGMEAEIVHSVVASNFQRSYKVRAKSEKEYMALPSQVKQFAAELAGRMKMPALETEEPTPQQLQAAAQAKQDAIERVRNYE